MKKLLSFALVLCLVLALLPVSALGAAVVLSPQNLTVDGKAIACEKYNIDGANYFKLRDIACLLSGTPAHFAVTWDADANAIVIAPGFDYAPVGGELLPGEDKSASAVPSAQTVWFLDAAVTDLSVYNIGGNNFFKLRDLGSLIGFGVDYDAKTNTAIITTGAPVAVVPERGTAAQAEAYDALWNWVWIMGEDMYETDKGWCMDTVTYDDGTAIDYWLVASMQNGEPLLYLASACFFADGQEDAVWIWLERGERAYPAAYLYSYSGNGTPDLTAQLTIYPSTFDGSVPVVFETSEPALTAEQLEVFPSNATLGFADLLRIMDDFVESVAGLRALDGCEDFGFTPEQLDTSRLP